MVHDGFQYFSRKVGNESKKGWTDFSSNGFSTGSLYSDLWGKTLWSVYIYRVNTLKFCIFHHYFDYVFFECVWIDINDHMNPHFPWKWSFHVLILFPLQAWRKLMKNWWFLIDLRTSTGGHEIMKWNTLRSHKTWDFDVNSVGRLSSSLSTLNRHNSDI